MFDFDGKRISIGASRHKLVEAVKSLSKIINANKAYTPRLAFA